MRYHIRANKDRSQLVAPLLPPRSHAKTHFYTFFLCDNHRAQTRIFLNSLCAGMVIFILVADLVTKLQEVRFGGLKKSDMPHFIIIKPC